MIVLFTFLQQCTAHKEVKMFLHSGIRPLVAACAGIWKDFVFFVFTCKSPLVLQLLVHCQGLLTVTVDAVIHSALQMQSAISHNQNASIYDKEKGPQQKNIYTIRRAQNLNPKTKTERWKKKTIVIKTFGCILAFWLYTC